MLEGSALKLAGAVGDIQRIAARLLMGWNEGIGTDEWSGNQEGSLAFGG
jgi:hypothetical protein